MLQIILAIEDDNQRREVEQWYITYYKMMRKLAYDIVLDLDLAEDMVNNAFIKIINNYGKISTLNCSKMTDYFVKTIKSVSIDYLRKHKKFKELPLSELEEEISNRDRDENADHNPEKMCISEENIEIVVNAMEKLSERDSLIIWAKYFMEMTDKEIQDNFGIKSKYVHVFAKRARDRLVRIISGDAYNEKVGRDNL